MYAMKMQIFFHDLLKKNRKFLIQNGFKPSTLTMYAQGKRIPRYEVATRIAALCGVSVMKIPWIKIERNT
jgi:hypothetical protein